MRKPLTKLSEIVPVRFEPGERQRLQRQASCRGMSLSALIRLTAMAQQFPPPKPTAIDKETIHELAHWGNNLNQLSFVANVARQQGVLGEETFNRIVAELSGIAAGLTEIRGKVLS
jgi:hypothetical protein